MTDLEGQTALVTGSARRIGASIVRALASAGASVVVHHNRSGPQAKALVADLERQGHHACAVRADLSGRHLHGLVAKAAKAAGTPITMLVNNASTFPPSRIGDLSWDAWTASLRTDAWAPLDLTRQLAAQLPPGRDGAVVNILDARITDDDRLHAGYWLAKRMLADITRLCALEYAPRLRVNAVAPGPILGDEHDTAFEGRMVGHLPLARIPSVNEVAQAVVQLMTARSTTGQVVFVDGGRHLGRQSSKLAAKTHQRGDR